MAHLKRTFLVCALGLGIASASSVIADEPNPPARAAGVAAEAGAQTGEQSIVVVRHGQLTVRLEKGSLQSLLDQVSEQSGIAFMAPDGVGTERLSFDLQNLPLEAALRQILSNHDAFFLWAAAEKPGQPASLKAVWIYPKGKGRILQPLPAEDWASTKELNGKLGDQDPEVRVAALKSLIERKGQGAQEEVLQALRDADDKVRSRALFYAEDCGVSLPSKMLENLAASDSSPEVRFLALQGLSADPDLQDIAQQALSDSDPNVRQGARELLNSLNGAKALSGETGQSSNSQEPAAHSGPED